MDYTRRQRVPSQSRPYSTRAGRRLSQQFSTVTETAGSNAVTRASSASPARRVKDADEGYVVPESGSPARLAFAVQPIDGGGIEQTGGPDAFRVGAPPAHIPAAWPRRKPHSPGRDRAASGVRRSPLGSRPLATLRKRCVSLRPCSFCSTGRLAANSTRRWSEEWKSAFNPMGHRHPVALAGKDVTRELEAGFEILRLVQRVPAPEILRQERRHFSGGIVMSIVRLKGCGRIISSGLICNGCPLAAPPPQRQIDPNASRQSARHR